MWMSVSVLKKATVENKSHFPIFKRSLIDTRKKCGFLVRKQKVSTLKAQKLLFHFVFNIQSLMKILNKAEREKKKNWNFLEGKENLIMKNDGAKKRTHQFIVVL